MDGQKAMICDDVFLCIGSRHLNILLSDNITVCPFHFDLVIKIIEIDICTPHYIVMFNHIQ